MQISSTLLIAIMFVTILTFGIAGILTSIAGSLAASAGGVRFRLHHSWMVLLLLAYMGMFWHTPSLFQRGEWGFGGFLFVLLGPILMFFTTSVLLSPGASEEWSASDAGAGPEARRFFVFFGLVQAWIVCMDFLVGRTWTGSTAFSGALLATAVLLVSSGRRVVPLGTAVAWLLYVSAMVLRGWGVIA